METATKISKLDDFYQISPVLQTFLFIAPGLDNNGEK